MKFANKLITWYLSNKRDLPWRNTENPYYIWLSEIILQQTRIEQGLPYYEKFIKLYPTIFSLATAKEEAVLKLWQGLGYYSRARNLHATAKEVVSNSRGKFPVAYNDLIELKGIGDYTASAIASICGNEKTAVVDGNVYRFLARYFNISVPINSSKGKKYFKSLAQELISDKNPGDFNQAIMEFGATICKPQNPLCSNCIFKDSCLALSANKVLDLPVKTKRIQVKKRYFNFLVFINNQKETIIEKRTYGIWKNLYQFPLIETEQKIDHNHLIQQKLLKNYEVKKAEDIVLFNDKIIIHKLTHQHLYIKFWIINKFHANEKPISWNQIKKFPVPLIIDKFINQYSKTNFFSNFER